MSISYTFFSPAQLPLTPASQGEETARSFTDLAAVQEALGAHLPRLAWEAAPEFALARGTVTEDEVPFEFSVIAFDDGAASDERVEDADATLVVSLRCSGRVDSAPFVQRLCDASGWIAFDDRFYLFQPHQPPVPAGG